MDELFEWKDNVKCSICHYTMGFNNFDNICYEIKIDHPICVPCYYAYLEDLRVIEIELGLN